ncbi:hypothetical protein TUM3794_39740 [Shewanella colwelliana]|uniref:O-antigen polymerase n=1 Tax=Shewanella colwelliana TaxID=23 RepID=A0ABQ4PGK9_SHECO|nr:hypothetical protein [Shewanella colwelliana]GIU46707.1 hypothetical protein TUM3794_39740 [Shewanella colwelliana]
MSTPLMGFFQLVAPVCLSLMALYLYRGDDYFQFGINVLVLFGFVNAVGGIVQFYISPNLFGLISSRVYDGTLEYDVTKRAVSILSSPQSLSIYLAFCLTIVRYLSVDFLLKIFVFVVIFICGVLSGSKAFFVFLLAYMLLSTSLKNVTFVILVLLSLILFSFYYRTGIDTFDRVLDLPVKLMELGNYGTFKIWKDFILFPSSMLELFFGRGIGVMSTASQTINNYQTLGGSTESFLIQLYFELGLVGLFLFILMFSYAPLKYIFLKSNSRSFAISIISLFSNMAFSPAFFGFTTSCLFFFAFSICLRANIFNEKDMCVNDSVSKR